MTGRPDIEGLTPEAVSKLNVETKREILVWLEAYRERRKYNYVSTLYPDDGPFRRDLYHKHIEFFAAGKTYQERLNMSGNRCISPWTYIETQDSKIPALKVLSAKSSRVVSWDGVSQCDGLILNGFLQGIEPAYRVVMDNGEFFDCSRKHEVLTNEGFLSFDRLMSLSDGLRCWHRAEDYQANCVADGYLDDQQLRLVSDNGLTLSPSQGDALRRNRLIFSHEDAKARKSQYSRFFQPGALLSSRDDQRQILDLFSMFSAPAVCNSFLRTSKRHSFLAQLASELNDDSLSHLEDTPPVAVSFSLEIESGQSYAVADKLGSTHEANQYGQQSLDVTNRLDSVQELHRDTSRIGIFYPSFHPELVGRTKITAVVPIGYQPILDGQVPGYNNYLAAGVYHHNCGKTLAGAFEVSAHLTGHYPEWWPGRVFDHPVNFWAAGNTVLTTRDIVQLAMLGPVNDVGSGMVPKDKILKTTPHPGAVANAVDTTFVKHKSGGISQLGFKAYAQGRKNFEGTAKDGIWYDEETPMDVYGEGLMRIITTKGICFTTFTPLQGLTELVLSFLPHEYSFSEVA